MKKINIIFLFLLPFLLTKGWVQAQSVGLRMPDTTCVQGTEVEIPIYIDSTLTGKEVYSYSFQLSFNPDYMQPESVIISGTVSEALGMPVLNTSVSGLVSFATAGTVPLTGNGKLIIIKWLLKNSGWTQLSFTDAKHNVLNEGTPPVTLKSGSVSIQQAPTITVYPDTKRIAKGDQLQMNAYGGTTPYSWFLTDSALADIDENGLLTAKESGMEKVVAIDSYGVKDTTNNIEIRPLRLSIPQDLTQWEGLSIDVPVLTTDLTGMDISSGNFQLAYNSSVLSVEKLVQTGTMLETSQVFMHKSVQTVSIAFAGSTVLSGSGTLVFVRFKVLANSNGNSNLTLDNALMNDNIKAAYTDGNFTVKNYTSRYIYPSQADLVIGETVQLNLYGEAISPWTWSVNDSTVAIINQEGVLTGKKRGVVIVTVVDSVGAPAYSGNFNVFDTRINIPDTSICHFDTTIEYPISMITFPHDSIYSFEGQISFNNDQLSFIGIESSGTISQNWISAINVKAGTINFAGSGNNALKNQGKLLKLKFLPKSTFTAGSWAGINFDKFSFNEGTPSPLIKKTGSISGITGNTANVEVQSKFGTVICEGETATFKSFVVNGGNPRYQWLKNGNPISGEISDSLQISSLANNDIISCKVISNDPCIVDSIVFSNTISMTVNPKPLAVVGITGETTVVGGTTKTYTVSDIQYADSYIWQLSEGLTGTSTANSINVYFDNNITSGKIKVYGVNSCGEGSSDSISIDVSMINGFNNLANEKTSVFPNPVINELNVSLFNPINDETRIEIFDATGRILKLNSLRKVNLLTFDFSTYNSGIYLLKISYANKTELIKIVKQ